MNKVAVIFNGGTISMKVDPKLKAAVPSLTGEEIMTLVTGIEDYARVESFEFSSFPSPHMTPEIMMDLTKLIRELVAGDFAGVVVTHGTDTLEETAYLVDNDIFEEQLDQLGITDAAQIGGMYIERGMYSLKKSVQNFFRELLELLFQAAALVIDVIRTFFLIVLAILGPIAFAISVWDGFQSTLTQWFTRYISVYLWLPASDLFSCILARIQVLMLQNDITELQNNPSYSVDASNAVYIVFMIIGIIGYFTIPTIAGWIIQAGGMGNLGKNVNNTATKAGAIAGGGAGAAAGNVAGKLMGR